MHSIIKIRLLISISLFFAVTSLQAQEKKIATLTLEDVIFMASNNSHDALIAKHGFLSSYWYYRSFKASYRPQLTIGATLPNFNRSIEPVVQNDGSTNYIERQFINNIVDITLTQKIGPTGGNISLVTGLQRYDNINNNGNTTSYLSTPINLVLQQPLFQYNAFKWDKKTEPLNYEKSKRDYLEKMEKVSIKAVNYFFNLMNADIRHKIALKNKSNYDTLYNVSKGRYELGKIPENDLLQMELNLLQATSRVEDTRLDYELAMYQFRSFLRITSQEDINLIAPNSFNKFDINTAKALAEAEENSSMGLSFQLRSLNADKELNRARMQGRFDLNIYAVVGLTQTADNLPDAYNTPLDEEQFRVGINMPIVDWGVARGKIKVQESNRELVYEQIAQDKIDFSQNIYLNVARLNMQDEQVIIAAKADTVAKKSYDITQKRYMIGKDVQFLELNNAQIATDNAKISYYNELKTYWNFYYTIREKTLFDFEKNEKIDVDENSLL